MKLIQCLIITFTLTTLFKGRITSWWSIEVCAAEYLGEASTHVINIRDNLSTALDLHIVIDLNSSSFPPIPATSCSQLAYISCFKANDLDSFFGNSYIFINSIGYYYAELLYQIFDNWGIEVNSLAIVTDDQGSVVGESMIDSLRDGTGVILMNEGVMSFNMSLITKARNFILFGQSTFIEAILNQSRDLNLLSSSNTWFLVSTDGPIQYEAYDGNIIVSLTDNYVQSLSKMIINTCELYNISTMISNCSVSSSNKTNELTTHIIKNIPLTELIIDVKTLYSKTEKNNLQWTSYHSLQSCNCNQSGSFKYTTDVIKLQRPQLKPTMRVSFVHEPPYVYKDNEKINSIYTGYLIDILTDISTYNNFTYILSECTGGIYGMKVNGLWSGCIGDLVNNRADMVLAPLAVTSEREDVIDFLTPYLGTSGLQVLRKHSITKDFLFLDVFSTAVWISCLAVIMITSIILYVYQQFESHVDNQNNLRRSTFGDAIWFVVSSICFEGSGHVWINGCSRILIAGFWFFTTVFMACFTANMAALLTNIRLEDDSSTVLDELKNRDVNLTVVADSAELAYIKKLAGFEDYFLNIWKSQMYDSPSTGNNTVWTYPLNSVFTNVIENLRKNKLPNSTILALQMVSENNFKLILDSAVGSYIRNTYCNFGIVSDPVAMHPIGLAVVHGSKFKRIISERLLLLQQTQSFEKLHRKWWGVESTCERIDSNEGLSLIELQGSFYVLFIGVFLSFIVLFTEMIFHKVKCRIALSSPKPHVYSTETNDDKTVTNTEDNEPIQSGVFILDDTIGSELTETNSDVDISIDSTDIETLTLE